MSSSGKVIHMANRNDDLDRMRERLGLAPLGVQSEARPGAVFVVSLATGVGGDAVRFPEGEIQSTETKHDTRRVVVAQSAFHSQRADPRTVLVIPCSASHKGAVASWDLAIPESELAFSKNGVVAYVSLVQPILKSKLIAFQGMLSPPTLAHMQRRLAVLMGLQDPAPLPIPPRTK